MRFFVLLFPLLFLFGCMDSYQIPYVCNEKECKTTVQKNQTEAQSAQDEYQAIQNKRSKK